LSNAQRDRHKTNTQHDEFYSHFLAVRQVYGSTNCGVS